MSKEDDNEEVLLQNWVEDFGAFVAKETFSLVKTLAKPKKVVESLGSKVVHHLIKQLVFRTLTEYKSRGLEGEEAYEYTTEVYFNLKQQLQHDVGMAFEEAFSEYAGRPVEYYCQISVIPDPLNKEYC